MTIPHRQELRKEPNVTLDKWELKTEEAHDIFQGWGLVRVLQESKIKEAF